MAAPWYRWDGEDLILQLYIQANASRTELCGPHGDRLKLRSAAPPVDGKANEAIIDVVSKLCGVGKSRISLVSGGTSKEKTLRIQSPRRLPPQVARPSLKNNS